METNKKMPSIIIPKTQIIKSNDIYKIVNSSDETNLTSAQIKNIVSAFESKAYDMASQYVWKIAMSKLKESLAQLGMDFIGEMLERKDINEFSAIDNVLTDFTSIELAQKLGMIDNYGAMKLHQAYDIVQYHFSQLSQIEGHKFEEDEAKTIIKTAVSLVLSVPSRSIAQIFVDLRRRILSENINEDDEQLKNLLSSSIFYIRTFLTILSNKIRKEEDNANLSHAISNYSTVIPLVWDKLSDSDKWNVGFLYRDVSANGNETASNGVKKTLSKVKGFDYVPETLRSETFIAAARKQIDAHYGYNNFYNEPNAVRALANLGTVIPEPAFAHCIEAYILAYVGNCYGHAYGAEEIAKTQLKHIDEEHWTKFFNQILPYNDHILYELAYSTPMSRFSRLFRSMGLTTLQLSNKTSSILYKSILSSDRDTINRYHQRLVKM